MTPEKRDELLIRLDERTRRIREDQKTMQTTLEGDTGFGRCQVHTKQIASLLSSRSWFRRTVVGGGLLFLAKLGFDLTIRP